MPVRSIGWLLPSLFVIGFPFGASAAPIHFYDPDVCLKDCGFVGIDMSGSIPGSWIVSDLHLITAPLPSAWTMMFIGLAMAFAAYRLFSVPD